MCQAASNSLKVMEGASATEQPLLKEIDNSNRGRVNSTREMTLICGDSEQDDDRLTLQHSKIERQWVGKGEGTPVYVHLQ